MCNKNVWRHLSKGPVEESKIKDILTVPHTKACTYKTNFDTIDFKYFYDQLI